MLTSVLKAEVAFVDQDRILRFLSFGVNVPAISLDDNEVRDEATTVYPRENPCSTAQRDRVFTRETACVIYSYVNE